MEFLIGNVWLCKKKGKKNKTQLNACVQLIFGLNERRQYKYVLARNPDNDTRINTIRTIRNCEVETAARRRFGDISYGFFTTFFLNYKAHILIALQTIRRICRRI